MIRIDLDDGVKKNYEIFKDVWFDDDGHPTDAIDLDSTQLKIADRIKNNILPSTLGLFDIVTELVEDVPVIKILVSSGWKSLIILRARGCHRLDAIQELALPVSL